MKLKFAIGSLLFFLALAVGMFVAAREPQYAGCDLSGWLGDLDYGMAGFNWSSVSNAENAVREIGPRGVPTLITMMRYRESQWRVRLHKLLARQKIIKVKEPLSAEHVQWRGVRGVWILGSSAKAATPELIVLLTNQSTWVKASAAMAVGKMGSNAAVAIPALIKNLDDSNTDVRRCTALGLRDIGPAANAAIPALVRHFTDSDPDTSSIIMWTFLSLTNDKAAVLPHLVSQLRDGFTYWRGNAVGMLGSMGQDARATVPELRKLLDDPDRSVRYAVTNALSKIEGMENQMTNAPTSEFRFHSAPSKRILEFYSGLVGKRIEIAGDLEITGEIYTHVSISSYGAMPLDKALRLIEQELSEQANLLLTPATNGTILVTYKQRED